MPTRGPSRNFLYPSLANDTSSFRLLEIVDDYNCSRQKAWKQPITCKLRTFSSSSSSRTPEYSALSYTWGCPFPEDEDSSGVKDWDSPTRRILCNDEYVYVGQNLYDALRELVRRGWFGFYWIDSLCINQGNVLERNAQVAIMGDIFQNASEVICWLGRADRYLDDAAELHRRLIMIEEKFGNIEKASWSPEEVDRACRTSEFGMRGHKTTASLCGPCKNFWQRRWFSRLWVAQEVALAKRLTVACGEYKFDWEEMVLVAKHANAAYSSVAWSFYFESEILSSTRVIRLDTIRHLPMSDMKWWYKAKLGGRNELRNAYLLVVLQMTTHLQATDPRDKVFGLLGLVSRAPVDKKSAFRPIHVDYDLSICEIFTRFATALIIELPHLSLLAWQTYQPGPADSNLPSWVPDFSAEDWYLLLTSYRYRAGIVYGQRSLREVNDKILQVCGHLLDTISSSTTDASCVGQLQFLRTIKKTARWQPDLIESFCRATLFCCDKSKHMTTRDKDSFRAWLLVELSRLAAQGKNSRLQNFRSGLEALRTRITNGTLPSQKTIDLWSMPDLRTHADQVQMLEVRRLAGIFWKNLRGVLLAFTNSGLLASTDSEARVGDQIWIIRDAQVPIILRPIPQSRLFTLVGPAYVDGVMFGEALKYPDCPQPVQVEIV